MPNEWLNQALRGIDQELEDLQGRITELSEVRRNLAGSDLVSPGRRRVDSQATTRKRSGGRLGRQLSPAARKRLSDSMKKRWKERKKKGANSLAAD